MKQKSVMTFLLLLAFLQTGCWDRLEVNDMALILATGINVVENGNVEVSAEISLPSPQGSTELMGGDQGGGIGTYIESATGETVADAVSKMQQKVSRELFWGQSDIIVIGEELAKQGIGDSLEYFVQHPQARLRNLVFSTRRDPKEILGVRGHLEESTAETIEELALHQIGPVIYLNNILQSFENSFQEVVIPLIDISSNPTNASNGPTELTIDGSAVFKGDQWKGELTMYETRGLMWIRGDIDTAIINTPTTEGGTVSMEVIHSFTRLRPSIDGGEMGHNH